MPTSFSNRLSPLQRGLTRECKMAIKLRADKPDRRLKRIVKELERYQADHPQAEIEAYRQNSVSVRIRVLSPEFKGLSRAEREDALWKFLDELPEEVSAEISV